ncbi:3-methyl-2-oxobutanoate hydroxymethyltransferase [Halobacillus andaensis]|uniref:3-methyl-2-oxobutanoate hydroxymethyltransferase n=1 Tax=Halobacillus andaensis TaxID=1176239 RepID=A0A917AZS5_HALAA|nr:3-methyl-2-oxobutanoate hydroxymethyltransferase [Halobacillus andaensis]MBP2003293.1 3-methyl-2-oxobutanoate hydroxymethyltransferase [Halobacillus andaensis]GGF09584.1 3-methyl-2-oxobutanoate hydroxymethyltransferase [Halobacillus andaensis]
MLNKSKLMKMKEEKDKITMLTSYDYPSARMAEEAETDMILVGDSLGMVVLGYDSTIPVTVNDMVHHGKAVRRGARNTFVVVDMPFMSYHVSMEDTLKNAKQIYQETEAQALKVEGAGEVLHTIESLTAAGIPVVGHLGLTPQSVNVLGGYKVQGKDKEAAYQMIEDAKKIQEAGAMALVLECVPKELASLITEQLTIPTIGIGAGAEVDGQVLVYHDILKYGVDRLPKFVKSYFNGNEHLIEAVKSYVTEVKSGEFPGEEHTFTMNVDSLPK